MPSQPVLPGVQALPAKRDRWLCERDCGNLKSGRRNRGTHGECSEGSPYNDVFHVSCVRTLPVSCAFHVLSTSLLLTSHSRCFRLLTLVFPGTFIHTLPLVLLLLPYGLSPYIPSYVSLRVLLCAFSLARSLLRVLNCALSCTRSFERVLLCVLPSDTVPFQRSPCVYLYIHFFTLAE